MKKKYLMNGLAVMAVGLFAASCSKDVELSRTDIVSNAESALGVKIAANQDWNMINNVTGRITVNLGTGEDYTLYVYDKSPFDNNDAVYFTKQTVKDASITEVSLSLPSYLKEVYVSAFDSKGASVSRKVAVNDGVVLTVFGSALPDSYNITRSTTTRGNAGINYTPTDGTHNANANEWADPQKSYGGWIVPDTLTAGQKERVRKYFQANPNLGHEDPQWRHFFVQQVYKGGTAQEGVSPENIAAADGQNVYNSDKMNEMSVGEANIHINNFNGGSYGNNGLAYTNVLDSGYTANDAAQHSHKDQIMLMVNIDDTSCFGYYESGSGAQINDKWALVSASDIDTWAASNGNPGAAVVDRWNRSFLGFDHALKYEKIEDAYLKNNGQVQYVKINQVAGNAPQYVWDGEKVLKISTSNNVSRRAKAKRRADGESANAWVGYETKAWGTALTVPFDGKAKALLVEGNYLGVEVSATDGSSLRFAGTWGAILHSGSISLNANSTIVEIQLTADDAATVIAQNLNIWSENSNPITFKRVYVSTYSQANGGGSGTEQGGTEQGGGEQGNTEQGGTEQGGTEQGGNEQGGSEQGGNEQGNTQSEEEYEIYDSEYIIVDGKMIPYLVSNTNQFAGVPLTHADSVITDSNMKISKEGKDCLNLPKFAAAVRGGYLPVNGSALKTWVKFKESDGYYSDWIVTITKAKRLEGETETHNVPPVVEPTPQIYTYAFEDTYMGDYDLNDVVLQVWKESDTQLKIRLCATGASKSLYVYYWDDPLFQGSEVHDLLGGSQGKFINTGASGAGDKFQTRDYVETSMSGNFTNFDFSTAGFNIRWGGKSNTEAESIWLTTRSNSPIGSAPYAVCIPKAWSWPLEWVKVSDAYSGFSSYAANPLPEDDWYQRSTAGKTY